MLSDTTVPQNGGGVNTQYMQNGAKNSRSSFEGSDDIAEAVALMEREQAARARQVEALVLQSAQENGLDPESAMVKDVAFVASRFGRPVRFVSDRDIQGTGEYDPATGVISLNSGFAALALRDETRAQELINEVIKHELAHSVERTKLGQQLEQIVRSSMGAEFDTAVQAKLQEYQNYGKKLDEPGAKHEVVAQWLGKNLYQNGFAQAVVNGDAKVGNVILRTLDQVRLALGGTQKSRTAANIAIVERLFMRALQQSPALDSNASVQYSIKKQIDGTPFVEVEEDILSGVSDERIPQILSDIIQNKFHNLIRANGQTIGVNQKTNREWRWSKNAQKLRGSDSQAYYDKIRAFNNADELLQASRDYVSEAPKHTRKDNFVEFARGVVDFKVDKQGYTSEVVVGITASQQAYLYDIINIQNKKITEAPNTSQSNSSTDRQDASITDPTVSQNGGGVNTQYMQNGVKNSQSSFEGSDEIAEAVALMERERAEQGAAPVEENDTLPLSRQSPTAPLTRGAEGEIQQGDAGTVPTTDIPSPLESGRENNPSTADAVPLPLHKGGKGTVSQAQTVEELTAEIGDEAVYRRMYYAAQIDRPPATLDIDGRTVNTTAYMDELYVALPDDDAQLTAYLKEREAEKAAQIKERYERGETEAEWTEVDLQILTARSKLEWSELGDSGESGSKTRRFYEQRLKGKDVNKAHERELLELLAGRSETYSPIANQKTFNEAQEKLRTDADYKARLQKRILRYKPNDLFNAKDAAAAQIMINDARNEGNLNLYTDLVQGLSRKGTELGRAVQVLSMQALLTPEGSLKAAQRTLRSQADKVMYDGANEDLDIFAEQITDAIERAAENKAAAQGAETAVIDMLEKIRSGQFKQNEKVFFGSVTPSVASKIKELTGIDVSDFQVAIEARQLEHILKRHGESGISDQSMADDNDIAKIGRVVRDPDDIQPSGKSTAYTYTENGRNKLADTVLYEKNVGEKSYYVVQAVANTKKKILYIVTAFSQNNANLKGAQQFTDAQGPSANAQDAAVDTPTDTIAQSESVVNVEVPLTRDELTKALAQDITGDNSPYITADEIRGILERAVTKTCVMQGKPTGFPDFFR